MRDETLKGRKMDAYVLLKILKYCTDSPARSYQMKYAVDRAFLNKSIDSTEDLRKAIMEIIHFKTIRGKFSSVHPDLAAEGITRVEVGDEGLRFIINNLEKGECPAYKLVIKQYFSEKETSPPKEDEQSVDEKEDDELVKTAWEEHSKREEEILASDLKSTMLWHV